MQLYGIDIKLLQLITSKLNETFNLLSIKMLKRLLSSSILTYCLPYLN